MAYAREPEGMDYQGYCVRPPSEANSILLQATLGCSHNKCTFCGTFTGKRFAFKDKAILERDLEFASRHCRRQDRLFIMDGDSLIMPMERWEWLLKLIHEKLPWLTRIGSYANSKGIALKSDEDLKRLKELGLDILYYGVETGHPEVLKRIVKGATPEKLIKQGQRVKQAGMKLSVTVLLGIGGRELSIEHAKATGRVLSAMDPDYVGALSLMIVPGTPLADEYERGDFELPDALEMVGELRAMIAHTDLTDGLFYANHASNYVPIKAHLPQEKEAAVALLDRALQGQVGLKPEWLRAL